MVPPKTWKCSRSKKSRPRQLKTWCELFSFLYLIVLYLNNFKVLGGLDFCLFTLYSHIMVFFIFLCLNYTDPFKIPSMNVTWKFYQNSRQTKKVNKTIKSLNYIWKQSMFTTVFWLSLNSLHLPEGQDIKWYRKLQHNAETFWKIKEQFGQSENFPDILESFQKIWKLSRHSGNFLDNMESVSKIWKVYRQPKNCLDQQ